MIQVRLWNDCYNNCAFCSLKGKTKKATGLEDKRARIKKLLELDENKVGIIGGEFFEGQLRGVENEWLYMIKNLSADKLFITANLINEQYLLEETVSARPDILFCTSYDTVGRFKNNSQKEKWLSRVNRLPNVFCTIIPTQDIISDPFISKIRCGINLCEPHLGTEWYKQVEKAHYHEHLIRDNELFNLPKRKELLNWVSRHKSVLDLMKNYEATHFATILGFDEKNNFCYEAYNRFKDNNFTAECGHQYFSRCYADSDRCLCCDLEEI